MYQADHVLARRLFVYFLIIFTTGTLRADQPPEILYASSPYTAILNLGATNSALLANASVCDAAGNFYVTGSFEGIAKFGTNALSSNGGYNYDDMYVVKYDPAGNVLWAKRAGGSDKDYGRAITLDGTGGIFVAGTSGSQPFVIGTNSMNNFGGRGMFLAHYDGNGNVLWAQWGGALSVFQSATLTVNSLAHDAAGNVILAGSFFGNPTIGNALSPTPINLSNKALSFNANGAEDLLLAKFAPNGALLWATNFGGTNTEYATSVAVDSTGAIYAAGSFVFNTVIGAQTYTNANDGLLLAKFSSAGDLLWSSDLSDATNNNTGAAYAVVVDAADRITVDFQFDDSAFHTIGFRYHGYVVTNSVYAAMNLLAQFDVNGNVLSVQRSPMAAGGVPNGAQYQRSVQNYMAVDNQNNIFLGGSGLANGVAGITTLKCNSTAQPIWTNIVPPTTGIGLGLPVISVDGAEITHVSTTILGDVNTYITVGWTNFIPGFGGYGKDQLLYTIASNFVAVLPVFLQQPTNMVYQPPRGLTNVVQARAWPAPNYFWHINNAKIPGQTNFFLALGPTTFTNQTSYFVVASNAYGLATSVVVNAQAALSFAPPPPTNISVLAGTTLAISAGANGTSGATYQWQFKGTNIANATNPTLALPGIALNQGGNYTLVLSNASTVITSTPPTLVTVLPVGSIDPGYTNNTVAAVCLARLPDGSYLAANGYSVYHVSTNGVITTNGFSNAYRWYDGSSADQYLGPSLVIMQPDNKVMVAGSFKVCYSTPTTFTNQSRIARLNPNGSVDTTFNVGVGPLNTIDGANYTKIESVVALANGQYYVAGTFNQFNGLPITNLVRLNNDGSLDATFPRHSFRNTGSGTIAVHSIALQADGKILLGGVFDVVDGVTNRDLTRLTTNGTVDTTFVQTSLAGTQGFGDRVNALLVLPDGKILAAGAGNYALANRVARFSSDGSRDLTWVGVLPSEVYCLTLTASNKLIYGCNSYVRRTTYDGVDDANFNGTTGFFFTTKFTYAVAQEPSGNVMLGGSFGMRRLWLEPMLVVPTFSSGAGASVVGGHFQISACGGVDGQNVVVQGSTDLVNWLNISTNVVTGGCISYTDLQTPPLPSRYYRLTVQP